MKSIDKLISDVQNFYSSSQFKPHLASVVIVGDIGESKIVPLSFLNDWKDSDIEPIKYKNLPIEFINERSLYRFINPVHSQQFSLEYEIKSLILMENFLSQML